MFEYEGRERLLGRELRKFLTSTVKRIKRLSGMR